jgi:hypothetical protein
MYTKKLVVAATVLAAGLAVVSSTTQNSQANPSSDIGVAVDSSDSGDINIKCIFFDDVEIDECLLS